MATKRPRRGPSPSYYITDRQVWYLRMLLALHATGVFSYPELAELYEVDRTNVSLIVRGKTWTR